MPATPPNVAVPAVQTTIPVAKGVRATWRISNGGWGGKLVLSSRADIQLSYDRPDDPRATMEYVNRLLMTTSRLIDGSGRPITGGDDPYHPDFGASLRTRVDMTSTASFVTSIQRHVYQGLTSSPLIRRNPPPQVIVQVIDPYTVRVSLIFETAGGVAVNMTDKDAVTFNGALMKTGGG